LSFWWSSWARPLRLPTYHFWAALLDGVFRPAKPLGHVEAPAEETAIKKAIDDSASRTRSSRSGCWRGGGDAHHRVRKSDIFEPSKIKPHWLWRDKADPKILHEITTYDNETPAED
jgi:hypothetical protein